MTLRKARNYPIRPFVVFDDPESKLVDHQEVVVLLVKSISGPSCDYLIRVA